MIVLAALIAAAVASLTVVLIQLRKAPLGFEDEDGFHMVQHVRGSAVTRAQKRKEAVATALKGARAHS